MIGRRLGNLEVTDKIGRGGMGTVYRARQLSLDRDVALKALPAGLAEDPVAAERFSREAQAMAKLYHPNIVNVIEVGDDDGIPYFAMQLIEGESLQALLTREGALAPERAADLAAQVADALHHAHERDIIHRDIKPGNILLDGNGRAVVTDFGIARAAEQAGLTATNTSIGTPEYMSPELVRGNPIDGRSDLYSLGVTLYHMVTGQPPFSATTPLATAMKHVTEAPMTPKARGRECPEWLESIILRALAKEPSDRFASAAEMAVALRAAQPVATSPLQVPTAVPTVPPAALAAARGGGAWKYLALAIGVAGIVLVAVAIWLMLEQNDSGAAPPEVSRVQVCQESGHLPSDDCDRHEPRDFAPGQAPTATCVLCAASPDPAAARRDAYRRLDAACVELRDILAAHQASNAPWEDYKAEHGYSSRSWHDYVMQESTAVLNSTDDLIRQYGALRRTVEAIDIPDGAPTTYGRLRRLLMDGCQAGEDRQRGSRNLIERELGGENPDWESGPYVEAKSRFIDLMGDRGKLEGSIGRCHRDEFVPDRAP